MIKVLLVTNDTLLERMLRVTLTINGLSVTSVSYLSDATALLSSEEINIVLLDQFFADVSWVIRENGYSQPILAFKEVNEDFFKQPDVDILVDPYNFPELKLKMNGLLKARHTIAEKMIENGHLKIDLINQLVMVKNEIINLGKIEFAILVSLAKKAGKIVSKDRMKIDLEAQGHFFNTSIYHHIKALRTKLKESTEEKLNIKFVTGEGFQLMME